MLALYVFLWTRYNLGELHIKYQHIMLMYYPLSQKCIWLFVQLLTIEQLSEFSEDLSPGYNPQFSSNKIPFFFFLSWLFIEFSLTLPLLCDVYKEKWGIKLQSEWRKSPWKWNCFLNYSSKCWDILFLQIEQKIIFQLLTIYTKSCALKSGWWDFLGQVVEGVVLGDEQVSNSYNELHFPDLEFLYKGAKLWARL